MLLAILFISAGFFGLYANCSADSPPVVINELMWMGSSHGSDDEFIELYNAENHPIDLSGWQITSLVGQNNEEQLMLTILSGEIPAGGYFLVSNFDEANSTINKIDPGLVDPKVVLRNDKLQIKLYKGNWINQDNLVDIADDGSGAPLAGDKESRKSMERNKDCFDGKIKSCWQTCFESTNLDEEVLDLATPGAENSQPPPPVVYYIRINELFPAPKDSGIEEFVELYNFGSEAINLDGWRLEDKGHNKCNLSEIIGKDEEDRYVIFIDGENCNIALNDTGGEEIYLYNPKDETPVSTASYSGSVEKDYSWSFDDEKNKWRWTSLWTPKEKNKFSEDIEYPEGVIINEILPNPFGNEGEKEYIELYNTAKEEIDISGWTLKDVTKSGKYIFSEKTFIKSHEFLVIYRKTFGFALNNSGDETVTLLSPNGKKSSSVSYNGAKENVSYNYNPESGKWRWSKDITPGKENKFNKLPKIEVDIDDKVYIGVYADFEVKVNDPEKEKVKVTWDFGDGHKSYKKETRHKYEKKGKYKLKVKIFDGSEEVVKEYKIEAKKFPHREVKIRALCPNPAGDDSENEWILVKNYSDDEVNLKGWSVATGSKKLYNHPIYEDIKIKKGKTGKIAREDSNFTLNNKKSKVELRYPDGKEAYKVKYDKGDDNTAEEDEVYEKTDDGWRWVKTQTNPVKFAEADHGAGADETQTNVDTTQAGAEEAEEEDFSEFLGGWSEDESDKISRDELLNYGTQIKLAAAVYSGEGRVLGASAENYNEPIYHFTESTPGEHYAVKFFKNIFSAINYSINKLIGSFY